MLTTNTDDKDRTFVNVTIPDDDVAVLVNPSNGEHMLIGGGGMRITSRDPISLREKYAGWFFVSISGV